MLNVPMWEADSASFAPEEIEKEATTQRKKVVNADKNKYGSFF